MGLVPRLPWTFCTRFSTLPAFSRVEEPDQDKLVEGELAAIAARYQSYQENFGKIPFDAEENVFMVKSATVEFAGRVILDEVSFRIRKNDFVVLLGDNGVGKTTIARLILEEVQVTAGQFWKAPNLVIGYLPQNPDELLKWDLEETTVGEYLALFKPEVSHLSVEEIYDNLRLPPPDRALATLSGGQRTRVILAAHLLRVPELLILDEPTNNLSPPAINWLCHVLGKWKGAVLLITHDRYMLQHPQIASVGMMVELSGEGHLLPVPGTTDQYVTYLQQRLRSLYLEELRYSRQMEKIKQLENELEKQHLDEALEKAVEKAQANAHRNKYSSDRSDVIGITHFRRLKGKRRQLAMLLQDLKIPRFIARVDLHFEVHARWRNRAGALVLDAQDVHVCFPTVSHASPSPVVDSVLRGVSLQVRLGERVVICGENASGKTTLLKALLGEVPLTQGVIFRRWGGRKSLAYMTQEQDEDLEKSVSAYLTEGTSSYTDEDVPDILTQVCGLPRELASVTKLQHLSTGQRRRLQLGKLVRPNHAVLILDEPTNHLDMLGKEALERGLLKNNVTLVASSHDTYFTKVVATRILWLGDGVLTEVWRKEEEPSQMEEDIPEIHSSEENENAGLEPEQPKKPGVKFLLPPNESVMTEEEHKGKVYSPDSAALTKELWKPAELSEEVKAKQREFVNVDGLALPDHLQYDSVWKERKLKQRQVKYMRQNIRRSVRTLHEREKLPDLQLNPASTEDAKALRTLLFGED